MFSRRFVPCLHLSEKSPWPAAAIGFVDHDIDDAGPDERQHSVRQPPSLTDFYANQNWKSDGLHKLHGTTRVGVGVPAQFKQEVINLVAKSRQCFSRTSWAGKV